MIKIILDFQNRVKIKAVKKSDFETLLKKVIKKIASEKKFNLTSGEIQLALIDDFEIQRLNKKFRGINQLTDVISLSYIGNINFPMGDLLGEIFISVDTAKRQASEAGISLKKELMELFVHGVLHIFGCDHENASDRKAMFSLQDEILGV